jgi:hypothetical protein
MWLIVVWAGPQAWPGHRRTEERRTAEEGEMNDEQFNF